MAAEPLDFNLAASLLPQLVKLTQSPATTTTKAGPGGGGGGDTDEEARTQKLLLGKQVSPVLGYLLVLFIRI